MVPGGHPVVHACRMSVDHADAELSLTAGDPFLDGDGERRLRAAVERHLVHLHYQPVVDLSTGRMVGVEALARWHDPELGTVGPDRFIPLAEATGLIVELGRSVLDQACRRAARWPVAGG